MKSTHQAPRIQYTFWNGESIDLKKYKDKQKSKKQATDMKKYQPWA